MVLINLFYLKTNKLLDHKNNYLFINNSILVVKKYKTKNRIIPWEKVLMFNWFFVNYWSIAQLYPSWFVLILADNWLTMETCWWKKGTKPMSLNLLMFLDDLQIWLAFKHKIWICILLGHLHVNKLILTNNLLLTIWAQSSKVNIKSLLCSS